MKLKDIVDETPEEFSDLEVIYHNDWSGYEEYGWIVIFKFFDEIMCWAYDYCVMSEDNSIHFNPYPITEEEMKILIMWWDENCGWVI